MVRTISGTLTSAINAKTRRPAITLTAEDHIMHLQNSVSTPSNTNGVNDGWSDMCVASDGSVIRVRVTWGGGGFDFVQSFQWQRITDPTSVGQWTSWHTFGGAAGNIWDNGSCCVSNNSGTLRAFAQQGSGGAAIWVWSSADNGLTWSGAPTTVLTPPANALIKGIGSAGNNDVFFLYDTFGGESLGASFYVAGVWSALVHSNVVVSDGRGVAVVWNSGAAQYVIVYADDYAVYEHTYTPLTNTWTFVAILSPQNTQSINRCSPRLALVDGVYTLVYVEIDSGAMTSTVYNYARVRQSTDLINWSNGFILHDMTTGFNCNLIQTTTPGALRNRYIAATLTKVEYSNVFSQSDSTQYVDLSSYVLDYKREEDLGKKSKITILLDNSNNVLNQYVAAYGSSYAPIGINTTLVLSEGYYTGSPPTTKEVVQVAKYRVKQVIFHRAPGENHLEIIGEDLSRLFDFENRYQYSSTNLTVQTILTQICVLSGVLNYNIPALAQLQANMITFVIKAGQNYRRAIDELARVGWVEYFLDQNEVLQVLQLNANDPVVWTYNPEIETLVIGNDDENANHIIVSGKPPSGNVLLGSVTNAEAFDDTNLHATGIEKVHLYSDTKLSTTALAQAKATFLMAQEQRDLIAHSITVPANPALQLIDVISLADQNTPIGTGRSANVRIWKQEVQFNPEKAEFNQVLYLEGV